MLVVRSSKLSAMLFRRPLAGCLAAVALLGCAEAFTEFHPRLLGLDQIEAPLHLQLPPHMLSMTHTHRAGTNVTADEVFFEANSKSQMWEEIFFYRRVQLRPLL